MPDFLTLPLPKESSYTVCIPCLLTIAPGSAMPYTPAPFFNLPLITLSLPHLNLGLR